MDKNFNSVEFLKSVKHFSNLIPNLSNDINAKNLLREVIMDRGYRKEDVFSYLTSILKEVKPNLFDRRFDIKGWKKIYTYFINHPKYKTFGKLLNKHQEWLKTEEHYNFCFTMNANVLGLNPDDLLCEIRLDSYGWWRLYVILLEVAGEKGIVVESKSIKVKPLKNETKTDMSKSKSVRRGRPKKSVTTKEKKEEVKTTVSEIITPVESVNESGSKKSKKRTVGHVHTKKSSTRKEKRGYDIPVLQYKKSTIYGTIQEAAAMTGMTVDEILSSMETKPTSKVDCIWKFTNNQKDKVAKYDYFHTYRNLSDINKSSESVCGKKINHSNVAPKLKDWKPISREETIWIKGLDTEFEIDGKSVKVGHVCAA